MAELAKTNPLPAGRYRMDLPPSGLPRLAAWTKANRGKVVVHTCVQHPERGIVVAFDVVGRPGAFPFGALGYPSTVDGPLDWLETNASQLEGLALVFLLWMLAS